MRLTEAKAKRDNVIRNAGYGLRATNYGIGATGCGLRAMVIAIPLSRRWCVSRSWLYALANYVSGMLKLTKSSSHSYIDNA